jgi:hypothetical protein
VKHAATPFTFPRYLLFESVTGASSKPSVDIVHRRRGPHVAEPLRSTSGAAFTLTSTVLVPFSSPTSKSMSGAPPPQLCRCPRRNATAPPHPPPRRRPTPLGESRHHPSCPATSPHHPHTHAANRAAWESPASPDRSCHCVDSGHGDHAAHIGWHGPVGPPPRGDEPHQQATARPQVIT